MKALKKIIVIGFGCVLPWVAVCLLLHFILEVDVSLRPVLDREARKGPSISLVSYADGQEFFYQNRNTLIYTAIDRGFDKMYNYTRADLEKALIENYPILNEKMGAGFWLWKPYIILKTLENMKEGEILFYADSGLLFRKPVREYFEKEFESSSKDIILFSYNTKEYGYASWVATGDTFHALKCERKECLDAPHVWAGAILLKNSPTSRQFIKDWLECCKIPGMLQGVSKRPPYEGFVHHQHDEGILGVVAAKDIKNIHYIPIDNDFYSYMRMHRRKGNSYSLLGYTSSEMLGFQKKLLEKPIFKQIRKTIQYFKDQPSEGKNPS